MLSLKNRKDLPFCFCFNFFQIMSGVGEENAIEVVHLVLEYLGEQSGGAAGEFFLLFRYRLPRSLFRLLRLCRKTPVTLRQPSFTVCFFLEILVIFGFIKTAVSVFFCSGDFSFFLEFLLIPWRFYFPYILSKTIKFGAVY